MSQAPVEPELAAPPYTRPTLLDFILVIVGCALSQLLLILAYPDIQQKVVVPSWMTPWMEQALLPRLPALLRLTEGIVLLWPLFLSFQRALGRSQGLTPGEWLWVGAWVGTALLVVLAVCKALGVLPPGIRDQVGWGPFVWYVILTPALALGALIIALLDLTGRGPYPWTHKLGLALVLWPVFPLAAILVVGKFV